MKKWFVFIIVACLSGVTAYGDTYPYLTFQQTDGTLTSMTTSSLTMTFADGKLIATNGSESKDRTVANLTSMFFSETNATTGLNEVAVTDADGEVEAYSLQGVSVGKFSNLKSLKESLTVGVYIVKATNGKNSKIVVK